MLRKCLLTLVLAIVVPGGAPLLAQAFSFNLGLDASQVPAGASTSTATGTAVLNLNASQTALTYTITLVGLDLDGNQTPLDPNDDVIGLHIHNGSPGTNGGIAFGILAPGDDPDDLVVNPVAGTVSGIWEQTDTLFFGSNLAAELPNLLGSAMYINVHSVAFPGGDIRADIVNPIAIPPIPTQDTLGFALLALLLALAGFVALRSRHTLA